MERARLFYFIFYIFFYLAVVMVNPGRMARATMVFASSQRPDEVRKRHAASIVKVQTVSAGTDLLCVCVCVCARVCVSPSDLRSVRLRDSE
jgi:hypothetical protein